MIKIDSMYHWSNITESATCSEIQGLLSVCIE